MLIQELLNILIDKKYPIAKICFTIWSHSIVLEIYLKDSIHMNMLKCILKNYNEYYDIEDNYSSIKIADSDKSLRKFPETCKIIINTHTTYISEEVEKYYNHVINKYILKDLPTNLKKLTLQNFDELTLDNLPTNLEILELFYTFVNLDFLPGNFFKLYIMTYIYSNNKYSMKDFVNLPNSLEEIIIQNIDNTDESHDNYNIFNTVDELIDFYKDN